MKKNRAVVLAGDNKYVQAIETTIKSMALYHENIDFYVLNQDIPQEWFFNLRESIEKTENTLNDIRVFHHSFSQKWNSTYLPHINYMTYARYFIPNFIDNDTVLYLDSDLVVTRNLDHLFELDLNGYYAAAVRMTYGLGIGFNAGMMVINNKRWREEGLFQKLMDLTIQEIDNAPEGDQTILNLMFNGEWLTLDDTYNFQIGFDMGATLQGHHFIFDIPIEPLPAIIHYISAIKPWQALTNMRLREVWWFYHTLSWETIIASKKVSLIKYLNNKDKHYQLNAFVLTATDQLEHIEDLIIHVPNCLFHIAAYTQVSDRIQKLMAYDNVRVYAATTPAIVKMLIEKTQVYLDINHGEKYHETLEQLERRNVPFIAFEHTWTTDCEGKVFAKDNWQEMVNYLQNLIKSS